MARLTKQQWLEAEELYRQGKTQKEIGKKYGVRPEAVSVHMTRNKVKAGEHIDVVRQEMEIAVNRKLKEFAEKRASRQIDTKEKMHTLINTTLGFFVKELQNIAAAGGGLDKISGSARALKEALSALKIAREELYHILEIRDSMNLEDAPDLYIMSMSEEEEEAIRNAKNNIMDDEEDPMIADLEQINETLMDQEEDENGDQA